MCVGVLSAPHGCLMPSEVSRGCEITFNWSYTLWWVLGTEIMSSGGAAAALNGGAISPALRPHCLILLPPNSSRLGTKP